jgi:hypothetical protein
MIPVVAGSISERERAVRERLDASVRRQRPERRNTVVAARCRCALSRGAVGADRVAAGGRATDGTPCSEHHCRHTRRSPERLRWRVKASPALPVRMKCKSFAAQPATTHVTEGSRSYPRILMCDYQERRRVGSLPWITRIRIRHHASTATIKDEPEGVTDGSFSSARRGDRQRSSRGAFKSEQDRISRELQQLDLVPPMSCPGPAACCLTCTSGRVWSYHSATASCTGLEPRRQDQAVAGSAALTWR